MTQALPQPFEWANHHITATLPHGRVLFSTRHGGVSAGPYESLNLGLLTQDDPANVSENRRRLAEAVGLGRERFLYGRQVHGSTVRRATEPPGPTRPRTDEDGQATALEDAPALVFTADCMPVMLIADGAVAALHGGWRGLADGILAEGLVALREVGGNGPVTAVLGPAARGCCYEVGEEVHARFAAYDAREGENLDLPAVAKAQLEAQDVEVHDVDLCTMCDPDLFFSHRRSGGTTGRQAGVVWRA
jgi:purine-nucleoside/S-methyl-5'-thioadenosine phosphorylase / adenosine deaminase